MRRLMGSCKATRPVPHRGASCRMASFSLSSWWWRWCWRCAVRLSCAGGWAICRMEGRSWRFRGDEGGKTNFFCLLLAKTRTDTLYDLCPTSNTAPTPPSPMRWTVSCARAGPWACLAPSLFARMASFPLLYPHLPSSSAPKITPPTPTQPPPTHDTASARAFSLCLSLCASKRVPCPHCPAASRSSSSRKQAAQARTSSRASGPPNRTSRANHTTPPSPHSQDGRRRRPPRHGPGGGGAERLRRPRTVSRESRGVWKE